MSATRKPSSSSWPSRYSRVRAWHRVGLIWQMEDAAISWRSEPAAFATPDGGGVIVFSSLRPDLRRAASIKGFITAAVPGQRWPHPRRQDRQADRCPGILLLDLRVGTGRPGRARRGDTVRGVEEDLL